MSFNTYGQKSIGKGKVPYQVWSEVKGVKHSGGVLEGFEDLPVGAVIPAGTPVRLEKAGGALTYLKTYELAEAASTTAVKIYAGLGQLPAVGDNLMIAPSDLSTAGTAIAVAAVGEEVDGIVEITLGAALTADAGAVLVAADAEGKIAVIPNGLLWHDIVKEEGDTMATGACVDFGRIFADRAPAVPAAIERELVTIKFDRGI